LKLRFPEAADRQGLVVAVYCRPWTSAVLALKLEVGSLAVISTAWLSLADPSQSVDCPIVRP
jgi:hypothetical protein